jgi:hypothetical protein
MRWIFVPYYGGSCLLSYAVDLCLTYGGSCLLPYAVDLVVLVVAMSASIGYLLLFSSISLIESRNKAVKCPDVKRNIFRAKKPLIS